MLFPMRLGELGVEFADNPKFCFHVFRPAPDQNRKLGLTPFCPHTHG